jgi:hypothetical protein
MAEDMLWCFILSKYVASIAFCEAPSYCYRYNPESLTHSDSTNEKRLIAYKILGQSMLDNTDPDFKYISCLCIVKVFYEIKKLGLEQDKELFFELMKKAMKSKNVPLSFMAMFIFLLLPKRIVKKMPFLWQKGLGILYRYGKCKDRNCRERK